MLNVIAFLLIPDGFEAEPRKIMSCSSLQIIMSKPNGESGAHFSLSTSHCAQLYHFIYAVRVGGLMQILEIVLKGERNIEQKSFPGKVHGCWGGWWEWAKLTGCKMHYMKMWSYFHRRICFIDFPAFPQHQEYFFTQHSQCFLCYLRSVYEHFDLTSFK